METKINVIKTKSGSGSTMYRLPVPKKIADNLKLHYYEKFTVTTEQNKIIYELTDWKKIKYAIVYEFEKHDKQGNSLLEYNEFNKEEFDTFEEAKKEFDKFENDWTRESNYDYKEVATLFEVFYDEDDNQIDTEALDSK